MFCLNKSVNDSLWINKKTHMLPKLSLYFFALCQIGKFCDLIAASDI